MNVSTFFHSKGFRRAALASVVALGAFGASNGFAATSDTATTDGTVVQPISITANGTILSFGDFAVDDATAGTITVDTNNGVGTTGGVAAISSSGASAAQFTVSGENSASYAITYPASSVLTDSGSLETMALTLLSDTTGAGGATTTVGTGTLDVTTGEQIIYLGGELAVGATQAAGTYAGSVELTVNYN